MGPLIRFCLVAIICFLTLANAAAAEHKRILMLHSVGRAFRPWNEYAKDMRAELDRQSPWPLDVQEHSLVAAGRPTRIRKRRSSNICARCMPNIRRI